MSVEFTEHEIAVMEKMTEQHKSLMEKLSDNEKKSFASNVTVENIERIQQWIGTDEEIEEMLFWVKGGKFDDPEWQNLAPDTATADLWEKAQAKYKDLRAAAVESQRRSDMALYSQFNPGLLFNGLAPAKRDGDSFTGVEFRLVGSVPESYDSISIMPADGGFEVSFGPEGSGSGVSICAADNYSLQQLGQLVDRRLKKLGFESAVADENGNIVELDTRGLRKSGQNGPDLGWGDMVSLRASKIEADADAALTAAEQAMVFLYDRFGLEREALNIGKACGNFAILRDENIARYLPTDSATNKKGLVLLTATLVCRRCRREMEAFLELARKYSDIQFVLVNLNSPLFKFYDRVFGDMGGGDPDEFRKNAAGVTPFTIVYAPDENGILQYKEYYGTGKSEASPEFEDQEALIERHIS